MKQNLVPVKDLAEELFYVEIIFVKENVIELKIHPMIFKLEVIVENVNLNV